MDFSYSLEASFVSARRSSSLYSSTGSTRSGVSGTRSIQLMDLNDVTREYENYKRKLNTDKVGLREMLNSCPTPRAQTPTLPMLPYSSEHTLQQFQS